MVNGATGAFAAIIATFLPAPLEPGGNGAKVELLFPSVMLAGRSKIQLKSSKKHLKAVKTCCFRGIRGF